MKEKEFSICESCYCPSPTLKQSSLGKLCQDCLQDIEIKKSNISKINHKVFLGNSDAASDIKLLQSLEITHILVCGKELEMSFPKDFIYMKINLNDDPFEDLKRHLEPSGKFITQGRKVLVHCKAGISRSPSIVIAYLMRNYEMSFEAALSEVQSKRENVAPNCGFQSQLKEYETILKKKEGYYML